MTNPNEPVEADTELPQGDIDINPLLNTIVFEVTMPAGEGDPTQDGQSS